MTAPAPVTTLRPSRDEAIAAAVARAPRLTPERVARLQAILAPGVRAVQERRAAPAAEGVAS